jgi:hypothetical protein
MAIKTTINCVLEVRTIPSFIHPIQRNAPVDRRMVMFDVACCVEIRANYVNLPLTMSRTTYCHFSR